MQYSFFIKSFQKLGALFLMSMFLVPSAVLAQEIEEVAAPEGAILEDSFGTNIKQEDVKQGQIVACSDYYNKIDFDINLDVDFVSYEAGDSVRIEGSVVNKSAQLVSGVDIKARLIKDIPLSDVERSEYIILDEFDIAENIVLTESQKFVVSYSYLLPYNAPSGEYQILFYAVEQDRIVHSGTLFSNQFSPSKTSFTVKGDIPDHIYLDQTQITVEGQEYNTQGTAIVSSSEDATSPITIPFYNSGDEEREMQITYDLYSNDVLADTHKVNTQIQEVTVPSKSEIELEYMLNIGSAPVYNLVVTSTPLDQTQDESVLKEKTISHIRISVPENSNATLDFVGISSYPLKKGQNATLITCFNTLGDSGVEGRVETVLYDKNKKELSRIEYEGTIHPSRAGLINTFIPKRDISELTIVSKIFDTQGNQIDSFEKSYSCTNSNSNYCANDASDTAWGGALIFIVLLGLVVLIFKRKAINKLRV